MKTSYFANGFSSFFAFAASFLYLMPVFYLLLRSAVANVDDSPVSSLRQRENTSEEHEREKIIVDIYTISPNRKTTKKQIQQHLRSPPLRAQPWFSRDV
jgi:hypothetical protein